MDKFAEGCPIEVFPTNKAEWPEDFTERLTKALNDAGIDWVYAYV